MSDPLALFTPHARAWFRATLGEPTDVQARSWPIIASRRNVLVTAPTGTGKTLTAFFGALDAFAAGALEPGATRVLYVSPLKALNNDIQRNLLTPLAGLAQTFDRAGATFPRVRVATRSGDTPGDERTRLLRRPPEILITTPESLQLMLTTARGRAALAHVETVVLDEVHAVADNRRGTVLAVCLERLAELAGDFQRVALSATVRPLATVASFVAGLGSDGVARPIEIVASDAEKRIAIEIAYPAHVQAALDSGQKIWQPLAESFRAVIARNRSTLFFVNSRRLAERITFEINADADAPLAYAHHGSLSREIRAEVEARLKSGALRAIVATNSLEMGIDIGALDEVVMVQAPLSIASTLQRVGRAGHRVGEISRGTLFPTHARDFVEAAALADAVAARDIEPLAPVENALDVLAQAMVSMTATATRSLDDLYLLVRRSWPYRRLERDAFDAVADMLAGRYAGSRVRELKPRLAVDRIAGTARAAKGAVHAFYASGGTIPDRGYYQLRHAETGAAIGELDEEFVWEAAVGQVFSLGTQAWQIRRITHNDVLAVPSRSSASAPPFWRGEDAGRGFHYSERIGRFLEEADDLLTDRGGEERLVATLRARSFDAEAATQLTDHLVRQREHTGATLPHRHHVLVEDIAAGPGGYRGPILERHVVLHTLWGGRVNRPLALALRAVLTEHQAETPEIYCDDDAIAVQASTGLDVEALLDRVTPAALDGLLRRTLESSGFFGARFRECAGRSLLLTRARFGERLPLWLSRLHAKKLMSAVARYEDFPVLLEAWRTCLVDEFDLPALRSLLGELARGEIALTRVETSTPSPFAAELAWGQISSAYMYADDTPETQGRSALSDDLIRRAVYDEALRPRVERAVVADFVARRQRTAPGYAPLDAPDLAEWLKERVLLRAHDWYALAARIDGAPPEAVTLTTGEHTFVVHLEDARSVGRELFGRFEADWPDVGDSRDAGDLVAGILSFEGPLARSEIAERIPLGAAPLDECLRALVDEGRLVAGPLVAGDETLRWCDADNLEALLRLQRARARTAIEPRPVATFPAFVAAWHRFGEPATEPTVADTFDRLRAFTAPVPVWLDDLIAARHAGAGDRDIDVALAMGTTSWLGRGRGEIAFVPPEETTLVGVAAQHAVDAWFRDPRARYPFFALADQCEAGVHAASERLWDAVWAGAVTADSVAPLRMGLARKFELAADTDASVEAHGRGRLNVRRRAHAAARGWPGNWWATPRTMSDGDALDALEDAKERARVLLDRYGIVARELANREDGEFRWRHVFRALRIMEFAGEVTAGLFFEGLSGPQFATPAALRRLVRLEPPAAWWIAAFDPAAPCGLGIEWPALPLPQRRPGNCLAFAHARHVLTAEGFGRRLRFAPAPDDDAWQAISLLLTHLLEQRRTIALEAIDDAPPAASAHLAALADRFTLRRDHRGYELSA
jgi:ATP-dependent Lhr-like helicase